MSVNHKRVCNYCKREMTLGTEPMKPENEQTFIMENLTDDSSGNIISKISITVQAFGINDICPSCAAQFVLTEVKKINKRLN